MSLNDKSKWHDNFVLVDVLLFVFPPMGIIGIALSKKLSNIKKVLLILMGLANLTAIIAYLLHLYS